MQVISRSCINDARLAAILNSAVDIVVARSSTYCLEQTVIEAMACGTTVAGCRVAGGQKVRWDNLPGILAFEADPASLAAWIHHLYVHPDLRNAR